MTGRPSTFSPEIADEICEWLVEGKSLREFCRQEGKPRAATVFRWLADEKNASFRDQYARAREAQADSLFDETLEIADDGTNDWMERRGEGEAGPGWQLNGEHVQRSRLRVDARKWAASKLAPKKYGDKLELSGEQTVKHVVKATLPTPEEWAAEHAGDA